MSQDKKLFILTLNCVSEYDDAATKPRTHRNTEKQLYDTFKKITQNAVIRFQDELKQNGLDKDVEVVNVLGGIGYVFVEASAENFDKIRDMHTVETIRDNGKVDHIRPVPRNPRRPRFR